MNLSIQCVRYAKVTVLVCLIAFSAACTTQETTGAAEAVATPISDLNLIRKKIPEILLDARDDPYAIPEDHSCAGLDEIIDDLTEVLEPKNGETGANGNNSTKTTASVTAVDALRRTAEGLIPFRGWVRKLTGAERHSKLVTDAIASGLIRRAFLKGYRTAMKCPPAVK